ncbi:unnamed protein product [Boreogadus saida]
MCSGSPALSPRGGEPTGEARSLDGCRPAAASQSQISVTRRPLQTVRTGGPRPARQRRHDGCTSSALLHDSPYRFRSEPVHADDPPLSYIIFSDSPRAQRRPSPGQTRLPITMWYMSLVARVW